MLRISDYEPRQRDREVAATHRGSFCLRSHHSGIHALSTIHHPISDRIPMMPNKRKVQMSHSTKEVKCIRY